MQSIFKVFLLVIFATTVLLVQTIPSYDFNGMLFSPNGPFYSNHHNNFNHFYLLESEIESEVEKEIKNQADGRLIPTISFYNSTYSAISTNTSQWPRSQINTIHLFLSTIVILS